MSNNDAELLQVLRKTILKQNISKLSFSLAYLSDCLSFNLTQPLESFLKQCQQEACKVWMGNKENEFAHEKVVSIELAYEEYTQGHTLFFALSSIPLIDFQQKLITHLGMADKRLILPSIFASPKGSGADRHFDCFEVFSVQLKGSKDWYLHKPSVSLTLDSYGVGDEIPQSLANYHSSGIEAPDLSTCQKFSVQPGDVLYIPRGYWHATDALTESISLNFALFPKTRADYMLEKLTSALIKKPEYRKWHTRQEQQEIDFVISRLFNAP